MSSEQEMKAAFDLGNEFIHQLMPDLVPLLERMRPQSRAALFEGMLCATVGLAAASTNPNIARQLLAHVQRQMNNPAAKLDELHQHHEQVMDTIRRKTH